MYLYSYNKSQGLEVGLCSPDWVLIFDNDEKLDLFLSESISLPWKKKKSKKIIFSCSDSKLNHPHYSQEKSNDKSWFFSLFHR